MGEGWHGGHAEPRELTGSSEAERGQGMATGPGRGKAPREGAPVASGKGATGPGLVPRDCQRNSAGDGSPLPGRGSGRDVRDPSPGRRPGPLGSSRCPCIEGGGVGGRRGMAPPFLPSPPRGVPAHSRGGLGVVAGRENEPAARAARGARVVERAVCSPEAESGTPNEGESGPLLLLRASHPSLSPRSPVLIDLPIQLVISAR